MATKQHQVYKCEVCGDVVGVIHDGGGSLSCCGQPMQLLDEQTADSATEKHVPVVQTCDGCIKVVVGSVAHPMQEEHFIEWIEVVAGGKVYRQYLQPGDAPEACFAISEAADLVREHCNKHGLWKA